MNLIDQVKLNKFALLGIFGTAGIAGEIYEAIKTQRFDYTDCVEVAAASTLLYYTSSRGLRLAREQIRNYNFLKKRISLKGIQDEIIAKFVGYDCGRRALKAALRDTGHYQEYEQLKSGHPVSLFDYARNSLGFRKMKGGNQKDAKPKSNSVL